jgi:hypothetical protein
LSKAERKEFCQFRLLIKLQEASVSEGHENEFELDEIS